MLIWSHTARPMLPRILLTDPLAGAKRGYSSLGSLADGWKIPQSSSLLPIWRRLSRGLRKASIYIRVFAGRSTRASTNSVSAVTSESCHSGGISFANDHMIAGSRVLWVVAELDYIEVVLRVLHQMRLSPPHSPNILDSCCGRYREELAKRLDIKVQ